MTTLHWELFVIIICIVLTLGWASACMFQMPKQKDRKKRVYIAHPYRGLDENRLKVNDICREAAKDGYLPISPIHTFDFLDESMPGEREKALELCRELVLTADELWLCGDWKNSEGCLMELNVAHDNNIPVVIYGGMEK